MERTVIAKLILALVLASAVAPLVAEDRKANEFLQSGLTRETVQGDLEGAIELYEKAVNEAGSNRGLSAKARLRLGAAYQKQGDEKARTVFESVARDYADQAEPAAEARSRLGALAAFSGAPVSLPGVVEAENYDKGGEGVAYHDTEPANLSGAGRKAEGVDVEGPDGGGRLYVSYVRASEWMKYSVNVSATGPCTITARVAAPGFGGTFHVEFNGIDVTGPMTVPSTGSWSVWGSVSKQVNLTAGPQVMRVVVDTNGQTGVMGNFDSFTISSCG